VFWHPHFTLSLFYSNKNQLQIRYLWLFAVSSTNRSDPSKLLAQEPHDRIERLPERRAILEVRPPSSAGRRSCRLEYGDLLRRKDGIVDVQVGLVVQSEGAVVEIVEPTDTQISSTNEPLAVKERRLVFVNEHAGIEQGRPSRAAGTLDNFRVSVRARHDDFDLHAAVFAP